MMRKIPVAAVADDVQHVAVTITMMTKQLIKVKIMKKEKNNYHHDVQDVQDEKKQVMKMHQILMITRIQHHQDGQEDGEIEKKKQKQISVIIIIIIMIMIIKIRNKIATRKRKKPLLRKKELQQELQEL